MTPARTLSIPLALLVGLVCVAMAAPALAEKKGMVEEGPEWVMKPPPNAGVGSADGKVLSFAHALNELASNLGFSLGSYGGYGGHGGCGHHVVTSKTDQTVCGFHVTSTLEDGNWDVRVKEQIVRELRVSLTIQIVSTPGGLKDPEGQTLPFLLKTSEEEVTRKLSPINAAAKPAKKREGQITIHLLKAGEGELPVEGEKPKITRHFEMKPSTIGITELIQHARSQGCTLEQAQVNDLNYTLIRMPEPVK